MLPERQAGKASVSRGLCEMRAAVAVAVLVLIPGGFASAQTASHRKVESERLGITCAQILKMSSGEWNTYFGEKTQSDAAAPATLRANAAYGKCYDARTDALGAALAKSAKGPRKAAREDFAGFEAALKEFAAKALDDAQPPADAQKRSEAALYEKQFRYEFYEEYEAKSSKPAPAEAPKAAAASAEVKTASKSPAPGSSSGAPQRGSNDTDEMTKAKNRFGELLGAQPEQKLHELHAAFGEILGLHEVDEAMKLAVYRYAIFLLEPSAEKRSYPPPF